MTIDDQSPTMGTVELASGRWQWTFHAQRQGAHVLFRHQTKSNDEMMAWISSHEVTRQHIREAAVDPLHRIWADQDGLTWKISLEVATRPVAGREIHPDELLLVFTRGGLRREQLVPGTIALGDLTCSELAALFRS